jgi:glucose uptake protein GlcU
MKETVTFMFGSAAADRAFGLTLAALVLAVIVIAWIANMLLHKLWVGNAGRIIRHFDSTREFSCREGYEARTRKQGR